MNICNECWGKGWIEKQGVQFDCRKCKDTGVIENEPLTNDEWRRTCSAEEFAKWIYDLIMHEGNTEWYEDLLDYRKDTMDYRANYHLIEMWLKKIHKDD